LTLARETIRARLSGTDDPPLPDVQIASEDFGGAFCTLRNRGRLRGCMGRFSPSDDLVTTIHDIAIIAMQDPRFAAKPVTIGELPELNIEISILSKMERTDDPASLTPGVHGIYVCRGTQAGCFLPQVATEQRWDAETLLNRCCSEKARLPADAWKRDDTEVYLFTAEVFGEQG
jgi:AmmeMemoRadiSam system protein A